MCVCVCIKALKDTHRWGQRSCAGGSLCCSVSFSSITLQHCTLSNTHTVIWYNLSFTFNSIICQLFLNLQHKQFLNENHFKVNPTPTVFQCKCKASKWFVCYKYIYIYMMNVSLIDTLILFHSWWNSFFCTITVNYSDKCDFLTEVKSDSQHKFIIRRLFC